MKATFTGKVPVSVDIDESGCVPFLIINERPISLRACAALSPSMLAVLEELAKPESNGGVFRIERYEGQVRLTKVGLMAHASHKAGEALRRRT